MNLSKEKPHETIPIVPFFDTSMHNSAGRLSIRTRQPGKYHLAHDRRTRYHAVHDHPTRSSAPAANITVQNNTFENCGKYAPDIIQITTSHGDPNKSYPSYIHQNISVTKNNFIRGNQCALFGICVDTLTFSENTFTSNRYNRVVLNICKNVTLDGKTRENSTLTDVVE